MGKKKEWQYFYLIAIFIFVSALAFTTFNKSQPVKVYAGCSAVGDPGTTCHAFCNYAAGGNIVNPAGIAVSGVSVSASSTTACDDNDDGDVTDPGETQTLNCPDSSNTLCGGPDLNGVTSSTGNFRLNIFSNSTFTMSVSSYPTGYSDVRTTNTSAVNYCTASNNYACNKQGGSNDGCNLLPARYSCDFRVLPAPTLTPTITPTPTPTQVPQRPTNTPTPTITPTPTPTSSPQCRTCASGGGYCAGEGANGPVFPSACNATCSAAGSWNYQGTTGCIAGSVAPYCYKCVIPTLTPTPTTAAGLPTPTTAASNSCSSCPTSVHGWYGTYVQCSSAPSCCSTQRTAQTVIDTFYSGLHYDYWNFQDGECPAAIPDPPTATPVPPTPTPTPTPRAFLQTTGGNVHLNSPSR